MFEHPAEPSGGNESEKELLDKIGELTVDRNFSTATCRHQDATERGYSLVGLRLEAQVTPPRMARNAPVALPPVMAQHVPASA